jgi:Protein of unknown function (DUF1592)/Protein of unknown function (DUF1588)/Protein of unknown function (DUF1587)/Protein of unknown function (DUF1585)/Protein of unknown function (DUF1595)/Planctomycete cytochrome C
MTARSSPNSRGRLVAVASCLCAAAGLVSGLRSASGADPNVSGLAREYGEEIRPLVQRCCQRCHGPKRAEAEVNLGQLATWTDARKHLRTWEKVRTMLDNGQMPPEEARQPSPAERTRLQKWVHEYLAVEARARSGDPGPVVLRRLNNAEYTYTLRDLTGVGSLSPAKEFPADGAAGEGFTNTGNALAMSPTLLSKYFEAAKEVAAHAVLLSDGFRFSPSTTRRDWTNEVLGQIRDFYAPFTDQGGGEKVNLQGIVFNTNEGGRLPIEQYLAATLAERQALTAGRKTTQAVARERGLNAKYLNILWDSLTSNRPSFLLDGLRRRWREAKPADAASLAADIAAWQRALWKFGTVGHIGKVGGPKAWMEPVDPLTALQEIRFPIPSTPGSSEVTLSLIAASADRNNAQDFVVWQQPRLVAPGRPDLPLRDVREVVQDLAIQRDRVFAQTARCLTAAAEAASVEVSVDPQKLARKHGVDADALVAWLNYLGIGTGGPVQITSYFKTQIPNSAGYDFIKGWGSHDTPLLVANSSDQHVRIPGNMKPHSVAVHPSPTLQAVVGFRSPATASMRLQAKVTHAHPECGNGVTWILELRRGAIRQRLAAGTAQGSKEVPIGPFENLRVRTGDVISLAIGPRNGNHACDLTAVDLRITSQEKSGPTWDLARDVSSDVLAGNPHADRFGNPDVWHFYTEPDNGQDATALVIPPGSLLTKWQAAQSPAEKEKLAENLQKLLTSGPASAKSAPDAALYRQLSSLTGPLGGTLQKRARAATTNVQPPAKPSNWGIDPRRFGKHPNGRPIDSGSLCVQAPSVIELRFPAELAAGCQLVTSAALDHETGREGSVQVRVVAGKAATAASLLPSTVRVTNAGGAWTADNRRAAYDAPILVEENSGERQRILAGFDEFRQLFPAALCYTKIVPVDEVITLALFYREDHHLVRLMLDDKQAAHLDRLWEELHYISQDALTLVDALAQLIEYATQDADPKVFEPLRKPFADRAAAFRQRLVDTQPRQLQALIDFAERAYRRPLTQHEQQELQELYRKLRAESLSHEEAFRLTLARVLVAPAFLYRLEQPGPGAEQSPVSDWELANRLSYFLWSSLPDDELRSVAAAGRLHDPDVLLAETRRMRQDPRVRRLATEFACQWLHIYDFDHLDEKSERHFPTFAGLRGVMYEESIRFFTDLFQRDGTVLDILNGDYTFVNEALAKHYGIPGVVGPEWRRVNGIKQFGRGGILAQATTLAKQSGASRTSPILRGNWISEVLLGDRLPRPPKDVPRLPDDETATAGLTVRQLVEKHASDPKCAVCHRRIDPFGFSLERFDAIGRYRQTDLGDRPIDTRVTTLDGAKFDGLEGVRTYLLTQRRDTFLRQFCRKFLGYALGRAIQLSDEPLLEEIQSQLKANDYRIGVALETIVRSRQFREIRGRLAAADE